jgi:hypothetical protein
MEVDGRKFFLLGGTSLVALGTTKMAMAELPSLLRGEALSPAPAKAIFTRAFNLWIDQAVRYEQQWSHEAEDVTLFRKQLKLGMKPSHGAGATAHLLRYLELGDGRPSRLGRRRPATRPLPQPKRFLPAPSTCGCMRPSAIPSASRTRPMMSRPSGRSQPWASSHGMASGHPRICCSSWSKPR